MVTTGHYYDYAFHNPELFSGCRLSNGVSVLQNSHFRSGGYHGKGLEAQRSLLDKIKALAKALAAKLHTLKDATSEKAKKAYAEYAKQKDVLDQKLHQAQRAYDDMQDYLKRLKAKLADMQKVVAQTEKKFGETSPQTKTVKKRYNDLYASFYGKNHYKEA